MSNIKIEVYDIIGRKVKTLRNKRMAPGIYSISWDAGIYASGVYFCVIKAGDFERSIKMLYIK